MRGREVLVVRGSGGIWEGGRSRGFFGVFEVLML